MHSKEWQEKLCYRSHELFGMAWLPCMERLERKSSKQDKGKSANTELQKRVVILMAYYGWNIANKQPSPRVEVKHVFKVAHTITVK